MNTSLSKFFLATLLIAPSFLIAGTAHAAAALSLSSSSGASGTAVTVSGAGYQPGESVTIWFGGTRDTTTSSGATYANSSGNFSIPLTAPWGASGTITVTATGNSSGRVATAPFRITTSGSTHPLGALGLDTFSGPPGTSVGVSGSAFDSGASITIYFGGAAAGTVVADSEGHFATHVSVPNLSEGVVSVTATGADNTNPPRFTVEFGGVVLPPTPTLTLTPSSGAPGTQVSVLGAGFSAGETIDVAALSSGTTIVADNGGNFTTTFTAPSLSASQGINVAATGRTSGRYAYATFYDNVAVVATTTPPISATDVAALHAEIAALQQQIAALTALLNSLLARLGFS